MDFAELARDPAWSEFNRLRSQSLPPGGESLPAVQTRLLTLFGSLRQRFPEGNVVRVTHADVIKAAIARILGSPLDLFDRIEISPGSLTQAVLDGPRIWCLHATYHE